MSVRTIQQPLTFEEFLVWNDGSGGDFELCDGFPMSIVAPTANHEDVADELCEQISHGCKKSHLSYVPKR